MTEPGIAIQADDVDFSYDGTPVLEDITLSVPEGDFLGMVGPNGSGKTTLLKIFLGLLQPTRGKIRIFGQTPERVRHFVGYVPQHATLDDSFPVSVLDVVLMGRLHRAPLFGRYTHPDKQADGGATTASPTEEGINRRFSTSSS